MAPGTPLRLYLTDTLAIPSKPITTWLPCTLWPLFGRYFANKEGLAGKFNQLASLRNGIRHHRSIDEVTRREGEAAIFWFEALADR
ncbi:MAG: hypothetical protein ACRDYZ_03750 [Acidimicrobiales bacterium]